MRVGRAFAFVDLSGFTSFTASRGDEEAGRVLTEFRSVVREVSSRRGVRVAKWQGDGAMFVSVDPGPLVEAVLEIEQRLDDTSSPMRLRGGITYGQVILFEGDDYIGSAVNLAARLCDTAEPHEILASAELQPHIPAWAVGEPGGDVVIRGFTTPVPVLKLHTSDGRGHAGHGPAIDGVKDPVCGMVIPKTAVSAARGELSFCSESCVQAWDDAHHIAPDIAPSTAPASAPAPPPA